MRQALLWIIAFVSLVAASSCGPGDARTVTAPPPTPTPDLGLAPAVTPRSPGSGFTMHPSTTPTFTPMPVEPVENPTAIDTPQLACEARTHGAEVVVEPTGEVGVHTLRLLLVGAGLPLGEFWVERPDGSRAHLVDIDRARAPELATVAGLEVLASDADGAGATALVRSVGESVVRVGATVSVEVANSHWRDGTCVQFWGWSHLTADPVAVGP